MDEFDDIFDEMFNDEIDKILKQSGRSPLSGFVNNYETKEIGDRVRIIDYSSISDIKGNDLDPDEYYLMHPDDYYIVINTRQRVEKKIPFGRFKQDLVIVNPKTNQQYRVSSLHVEITKLISEFIS